MSPLSIEVFNQIDEKWLEVGKVKPVDPPGSISNNKEDGRRDVYFFDCAPDDSKSTVYRSGFGLDVELDEGKRRLIIPDPSQLEVVKELRKGESYEMTVKTDRSSQSRLVRFIHK